MCRNLFVHFTKVCTVKNNIFRTFALSQNLEVVTKPCNDQACQRVARVEARGSLPPQLRIRLMPDSAECL
jgi:hypothetical protein